MTSSPGEGTRPLALVTGASSGIGWAYAERLAAEGYDLIAVARRAERLAQLKAQLEGTHGVTVQPLVADLATEAGMAETEAAVTDGRLQMLVDNAALAHYMPFAELPAAQADQLLRLNTFAPVRLVHAALPGMIARGSGTIVSMASLLAFSAGLDNPSMPRRVIYASTKAFLVSFIRLLANELEGTGVRLQIVCPGIVKTEFHTRQNLDMSSRPRMEPESVVQASMVGLDLGEVVCIPTLDDRALLQRYDEAMAGVFGSGMHATLAERYARERRHD